MTRSTKTHTEMVVDSLVSAPPGDYIDRDGDRWTRLYPPHGALTLGAVHWSEKDLAEPDQHEEHGPFKLSSLLPEEPPVTDPKHHDEQVERSKLDGDGDDEVDNDTWLEEQKQKFLSLSAERQTNALWRLRLELLNMARDIAPRSLAIENTIRTVALAWIVLQRDPEPAPEIWKARLEELDAELLRANGSDELLEPASWALEAARYLVAEHIRAKTEPGAKRDPFMGALIAAHFVAPWIRSGAIEAWREVLRPCFEKIIERPADAERFANGAGEA